MVFLAGVPYLVDVLSQGSYTFLNSLKIFESWEAIFQYFKLMVIFV